MEMINVHRKKYWCRAFMCCACILLIHALQAQHVKSYTIKNGKMYIALGKDLKKNAIDSFVIKYDLSDLDLYHFIKTGSKDSLTRLGWKFDIDNKDVFIISKSLQAFNSINDPGDRIILSQKETNRLNSNTNREKFGYNHFRNKDFFTQDSDVIFFLRGNLKAGRVFLAGSFNSWQPSATRMVKTDSGWIASVKLAEGKHLYKFIVDGNWRVDTDNPAKENDGMGNDNSVFYKPNYIFSLHGYANAKRVYVAGSFNDWKENQLPMKRTAGGWMLPVYLPIGTYTYRFVADGKWFTDPVNPDKLPNEFNDFNSVVRIGKPYVFKMEGFTTAKKVVVLGSFNAWRDDELLMNKTATGWELPYTLGLGNYEYQLKIDGKAANDPLTGGHNVLVIGANYTFHLKGFENARSVYIAGDINNWDPSSFRMIRQGDEWIFNAYLAKGKHIYKFVVDGKWILDPANKLWEQNEYNTGNSVLWIDTLPPKEI